MTSFAVEIEPSDAPRLAFAALAVHAFAAACPWLARVPAGLATLLTAVALLGFTSTLAAVPGRQHRIAALALDGAGCRVRLRNSATWQHAELGRRSRAFAGIVCLEVRTGGRRVAWLLPRAAAAPAAFRRLKARVRLSC
jgi:hypothetical protein